MIDKVITNTFEKIKLPRYIKGYNYLKEALITVINSSYELPSNLYSLIADKYKTTAIRVEKAINHAVCIATNREDFKSENQNFKCDKNINQNFIKYLIKEYNF